MKRWLAVLVVFLLGTQASMVGTVAADLSLLTDGGQTDSLDRPLVLWTSLYDGRILTVDNEGNVSVNAFTNGVLSTQWTVFLDVDANNPAGRCSRIGRRSRQWRLCGADEHPNVHWNITTPDPVNDAVLDKEGDLWLVYARKTSL